MIITGLPSDTPEPRIRLVVDTSAFTAAVRTATRQTNKLRRNLRTLTVVTEVLGLTADQVWARFYVRGGMDSRFVDPDAVDDYVRILTGVPGEKGTVARAAFLRGWAEHRSVGEPTTPVVWHRYLGDTAIQVHPEAQR
jgi:hypothetical protein